MKRQSGAAKRKAKKQRREIEAKGRQTLEDCGWRILHPSSSLSEPSCGSSCGPTNSQLLGEVSEEPNSEHLTERQSERVQSDPDHPVSIADETHYERYELYSDSSELDDSSQSEQESSNADYIHKGKFFVVDMYKASASLTTACHRLYIALHTYYLSNGIAKCI